MSPTATTARRKKPARRRTVTAGYVVLAYEPPGLQSCARTGVCVHHDKVGCLLPFNGQGGTIYSTRRAAEAAKCKADLTKAGRIWERREHYVVRLTKRVEITTNGKE